MKTLSVERKWELLKNFFLSLSLDQMTTKEMAKFSKNKCLSYFFSAPPAIINTWNYQPFENTLKNRAFQNHVEVFFWQNRASKVSKFFLSKVVVFTPLVILLPNLWFKLFTVRRFSFKQLPLTTSSLLSLLLSLLLLWMLLVLFPFVVAFVVNIQASVDVVLRHSTLKQNPTTAGKQILGLFFKHSET